MNINQQAQRPVGRGRGRGELLGKLVASLSSNSDESRSDLSTSTSNESLLDTTTLPSDLNDSGLTGTGSLASSRGRGKLIEKILRAHESISNDPFNLDAVQKPFGRGRGIVLQKLLAANSQPTENKPEESIESIDDGIEVLSLESAEKEPVIKMGTAGSKVDIVTNFLMLDFDSTKGVFEYRVEFKPVVHSKSLSHKLLNQHRATIGNTSTFDGVVLYLPTKIQNITEVISVSPTDGANYQVTIIYKQKTKMCDCIHLYNVLFDRIMKKLQYVRFGRKQFDPTAPKIIPQHKLEVWPGYVTAVDEYEDGVMLNLDVSHRLLCQNTVLDILVNIHTSDKENLRQTALTALLGSVVLTRYNNKTYRIDDIDWDSTPNSTFMMNGKSVSYIEYYMSHYGIHIMEENQPLLVSREERRVAGQAEKETLIFCLVPEICHLTGITDTLRSDQKVMRDIATVTRVTPEQRMFAYNKFCENVQNCPEAVEILKNWGLTLGAPRRIQGRQLGNETVTFGNGGQCIAEKGDFNRYVTNHNMLKVVDLRNWLIIYTKRDDRVTKSFVELMERNASPMGMSVCRPRTECLTDDKPETYVKKLRSCINASLQIIVLVCPSSRDDRYAAIKKICCAELPIPTQVINGRTLSNEAKNRAIVQKIALQMNCKMGGALWSINIPLKNDMICGIDTYHDADKKKNSVSAFIASLNATFTQWFSRATIQSHKEELCNGLCQSLVESLVAYKRMNEVLPERIIVYRDGVGDGQLDYVRGYEITQMRNAFKLLDSSYDPGFTFIVVQKRINARLFAIKGNKLENPEPGCVIDHTITRRYLFDFFLVPQNVRQGTVTPTHYIVVENTSNFTPDVLQRLSYKLCFLYYNWPGTVRVPACCQYAHKLAFLVGQSIKRQPAESLSDKLYYL